MKKLKENINYMFISFIFKIRDLFSPPVKILKETDIQSGYYVLDFGCGPGSYSIAASRLVGSKGKIYALDINSQAIKKLGYKALRERLDNIETIQSDCRTHLPDNSMDAILLYDVYHDLNDKFQVLKELYRVLKPEGILSFSDHHLEKEMILSELVGTGLFKLKEKNRKTFSFYKNLEY